MVTPVERPVADGAALMVLVGRGASFRAPAATRWRLVLPAGA